MIFITDRTQNDVLLGTEKGYYNVSDLNRVEQNLQEISQLAQSVGIDTNTLIFKTDWQLTETFSSGNWIVESQMERYLNNIKTIANALQTSRYITLPFSMDKINFKDANNIEISLETLNRFIENIKKAWQYSGQAESGV